MLHIPFFDFSNSSICLNLLWMILFYEREICFYRKKTTLLQGKVQLSVNRAFFKGIV